MAHYIVHSSIDENGKARGGAAGDQTSKEVCTRTWYSKPWGMVLRCPDSNIAEKAREIAIKLANSNLIGYDQYNRNSLYKELKKNNWNVDNYIKSGVKTETDCSSFVYAVYCCLIPAMRSDANAPTTSTSQSFYKKHGFKVLTDDKYTKSAANLKRGDLLNKAGAHIVMYCGTDVSVASKSSVKVMKTNDAGIKLIKRYESCLLKAYKLKGEKYYTIGYGHSFDTSVNANTVWTQKQCDAQLRKDLEKFEKYVNSIALCKFPKLNENQFSALVSYTYNRGPGGLKELINNSDSIEELSKNIVKYWGSATRYKTGLVNRRKAEKALFDSKNKAVTAKVTAKSGLKMRKANGSAIKTIAYDKTVTVEQKNAMTMNISNVNYIMAKVKCDEVTGYVAQKYLKF